MNADVIPLENKMKRRFQISLSSSLIVFACVAISIAAYNRRTRALTNFGQIENSIGEFLPRELDRKLADSPHFTAHQERIYDVSGISGGGASQGTLFRESNFDRTYCDKITFRELDNTEIHYSEGYNVHIKIVGRMDIISSKPTIEIVDLGGEYSPLAIACVQSFIADEFGITVTTARKARR